MPIRNALSPEPQDIPPHATPSQETLDAREQREIDMALVESLQPVSLTSHKPFSHSYVPNVASGSASSSGFDSTLSASTMYLILPLAQWPPHQSQTMPLRQLRRSEYQ